MNQILAQIDRSRPHPKDTLSDWAYWVRYRLERSQDVGGELTILQGNGLLMLHPIWSDLLQACVYGWLEQPRKRPPSGKRSNKKFRVLAAPGYRMKLTRF